MADRDQLGLFSELPAAPRRSGRRARYFFALWPKPAVRKRLAAAAAALPLCEGASAYRIKPERLHLTLAWLGEINSAQADAAQRAADKVQARCFALRIDRLGHFPEARVVWLGPAQLPSELSMLKAALDRELLGYGLPVIDEPFVPHVSCQRNAGSAVAAAVATVDWPVLDFVLLRTARSAGRADGYRLVKRWPLG